MSTLHIPVMLEEVVDNLITNPDGFYIDATFGTGGHSKKIIEKLKKQGSLLSIDCDESSKPYSNTIDNEQFEFVHLNFIHLSKYLNNHNYPSVTGILFDLGYSTVQLQDKSRGFSYSGFKYEEEDEKEKSDKGSLNMNLDKKNYKTGHFILNNYSKQSLINLFQDYGDIKKPQKIVDLIISYRKKKRIYDAKDLSEILKDAVLVNKFQHNKDPLKLVFQALRIEVNDELKNLKRSLIHLSSMLCTKGRALYLTFNSLEENIIKAWINENCYPIKISDYVQNIPNKFTFINNEPLYPSRNEVIQNWCSRSAKLWIIEKN